MFFIYCLAIPYFFYSVIEVIQFSELSPPPSNLACITFLLFWQVIDLISAVKELHGYNTHKLNVLIRDSENFTIQFSTEKGSNIKVRQCVFFVNLVVSSQLLSCVINCIVFQIDVEKLAGFLPLHLIAVLVSSDKDEAMLRYLLCGIRLLHSLCDLAHRHAKLEQVAIPDLCIRFQFYLLTYDDLGVCFKEPTGVDSMYGSVMLLNSLTSFIVKFLTQNICSLLSLDV